MRAPAIRDHPLPAARPVPGLDGRRRAVLGLAPVFVAALILTGCWRPPRPTAQQLDRGLIWLFPGVEGGPWQLRAAEREFRDAGVTAAIRIHDWWRPFGMLENLRAVERNRADAARIAAEIAEFCRRRPDDPVDLVGYSGGGGLAIFVAEALADGVALRNIILAQPALSAAYDLQPALRRVTGRIVHFHAPGDALTLGAGTTLFGTMDRVYGPSAGKDGFDVARAILDESLRPRLVQIAWDESARSAGHGGAHLGMLAYEWNRRFVAPWLLGAPRAAPR